MTKTKQKYCKKHGDKYVIHKDYSLCCHFQCLGSTVAAGAKYLKMYQHLRSIGQLEDLYTYLIQELLRENRDLNKPPILNSSWLFYRIQSYYNNRLKKEISCESLLPSGKRDDRVYLSLNSDFIDEFETLYSEQKDSQTRPDRNIVGEEMMKMIRDKYDDITLQHLLGEINLVEYAKLKQQAYKTKLSISDAKAMIKKEKEELQQIFNNEFSLNLTPGD